MERGFYSEGNINKLFRKHYKFLIAAKKSLRFVQSLLNEVRDSMKSRICYHSDFKLNYFPVPSTGNTRKRRNGQEWWKSRTAGYTCMYTTTIKDPIEALILYRCRALIEKAFGNLKERLNMRRTSVSSEENLEGKLFVQFVALIYLSYISKAMSEQKLYKTMTMQELLDELDIIECFGHPATECGVAR